MTIVGFVLDNNLKKYVPVYWTSTTALPTPLVLLGGGGSYNYALGINSTSQIVGVLDDIVPVYWSSPTVTPTTLSLLPGYTSGHADGINNNREIVGYLEDINNNNAAVYWSSPTVTPATLSLLPGYTSGYAAGINNNREIVGYLEDINNNNVAVYWASTTASPTLLVLPGGGGSYNRAFGINNTGQIVGVLDINNDSVPVYWSSPTVTPTTLSLLPGYTSGYAAGINNNREIVGYLDDINNNIVPVYWSSPTALPTLLIAPYLEGAALGINDSLTVSNICFPAGTPIITDQGSVAIEQLDPTKHTIKQQAILHITQTTTLDKYLIYFPKSSLSRGLPTQTTIMSKDHQIEFNGQLTPAYRFLDYSSDIKKVKYNGEILYNVLLAEYGTIQVNGLTCETLHPNNAVAKQFRLQSGSRCFKGCT